MFQTLTTDTVRPQLTADGLHLAGSILWLDAKSSKSLTFFSSANSFKATFCSQGIATEETSQILNALKKPGPSLVCQYNRPFSIGQLELELLPSGTILGGASLLIKTNQTSILYAPEILIEKNNLIRSCQTRKAKTLILSANFPESSAAFTPRKKIRDQIFSSLNLYKDHKWQPTVICPNMGAAQELTRWLAEYDKPFAVQHPIFRVNRVYEASGINLGAYGKLSAQTPASNICLMNDAKTVNFNTKRPLITIFEPFSIERSPKTFSLLQQSQHTFSLHHTSDTPGIIKFIQKVDPETIFFIGPYANDYVQRFKSLAYKVEALHSTSHRPLF